MPAFNPPENAEPREKAEAFLSWVIHQFEVIERQQAENGRILREIYGMIYRATQQQQQGQMRVARGRAGQQAVGAVGQAVTQAVRRNAESIAQSFIDMLQNSLRGR